MSKELLENIISYMAYERGHSAGEEEVEAIKRGMMAELEPIFNHIEELECERDKYRKQVQLGFKHLIETPVLTDAEIENGYTAFEHIRIALAKALDERDALQADNARLLELLTESVDLIETLTPLEGPTERKARAALATTPGQSLARLRNEALEKAAKVCDRFAEREMHPAECAGALRAMKEPE